MSYFLCLALFVGNVNGDELVLILFIFLFLILVVLVLFAVVLFQALNFRKRILMAVTLNTERNGNKSTYFHRCVQIIQLQRPRVRPNKTGGKNVKAEPQIV